ncbi:hypothetical protein niasHT_025145 [Heterodera trifolii]|uniref:CMP/dCMP-type deaminase domain-containing protein n=1 Tax=Heterodera trifolii TaxID=157864 RepID=A0ABD2K1I1_9BILA
MNFAQITTVTAKRSKTEGMGGGRGGMNGSWNSTITITIITTTTKTTQQPTNSFMISIKDENLLDETEKKTKIQRLRNFEIQPILPSSLQTEHIELTEAIVLNVTNKSLFSALLRILPPLPAQFEHLKRVNGIALLVSVGQNGEIGTAERTAIGQLIGGEPTFTGRHIPCQKPQSRHQLEMYRKIWPMSFHKNANLEAMIDGTLLTAEETARIKQLFVIVERTKGALFYDPATDQIVAECGDGTAQFEAAANPRQNPLAAHPVLNAIERLSANQRRTTARTDGREEEGEEEVPGAEFSAQYLATGFYAILAMEPCTMCAMALVHVRAKRVFFGTLNAKFGALCSKWRLQESPHINHHFDVFRIVERILL